MTSCDGKHNYRNVGEWLNKKTGVTYKIFKCASCGDKYEEETGGTNETKKIQRL